MSRTQAKIPAVTIVLNSEHPGTRSTLSHEQVQAMHVRMPAGPGVFHFHGGKRHRNLASEVPHRVPHFNPDLSESCETNWSPAFIYFITDQWVETF